jgi:hypothetical protein
MAKKQYFLTIDTETTINNKVVDFAAVVSDRQGNIINQCAVIVAGVYKVDELFYIKGEKPDNYWSENYLPKKYKMYDDMLANGTRMMAKPEAINRWLTRVLKQYNPILTAYNLAFDVDKMRKTGIDCDMFEKSFCLMQSAKYYIATKKAYKKFALENHYFTNKSPKVGAITIKTNAEVMTHFLTGNDQPEPHTSLEDVIDYELPILNHLCSKMSTKKLMDYKTTTYKDFQLKAHYTVK